ncbi:MAG: DUF4136 domain-containing protein [Reichenbachiella sp.]
MNKIHYTFFILVLLYMNSCSPKVVEFVNDDMDFSDYKTYRLVNYKSDDKEFSSQGSEYFDRIEGFINDQMKAKEFEYHKGKADLIVRYEVISTVQTESSYNNSNNYNQSQYYTPSSTVEYYKDGLLLIEFLDAKKNKLVWQGSLDIRYPKNKTKTTVLQESIDLIFETYPYMAESNEVVDKG